MEIIIERILSHPLLTLVLVLLCILMFYAILKRLVKMLVFIAILGGAYFGYVHFLERDYPLPEIDESISEKWRETVMPLLPDDWNYTLSDVNASWLQQQNGQEGNATIK